MAYGNVQGNVCQKWPKSKIPLIKHLLEIGPKIHYFVVFQFWANYAFTLRAVGPLTARKCLLSEISFFNSAVEPRGWWKPYVQKLNSNHIKLVFNMSGNKQNYVSNTSSHLKAHQKLQSCPGWSIYIWGLWQNLISAGMIHLNLDISAVTGLELGSHEDPLG